MRPARYDLNQIPYECAVDVTNRFKRLDLVNTVPEELGTEVHNIVQEAANKTIPKKKKSKKAKWLCEEASQTAEERREAKNKGERERYIQLNAELQNKARRVKEGFFTEQSIKTEENNRRERLETSSRKGTLCPRKGTTKDRNGRGSVGPEAIKKRTAHGGTIWKDLNELEN